MRVEQLIKFQKQVDSAIIGYLNILERKELLAASIEKNQSLSRLEPNIRRSILTIQDTLYASLIVEIHAWLFDKSGNSSNSSLYGLLEKLIDRELNTKYLERYFVSPPETINIGGADISWQKSFIAEREIKFRVSFKECTQKISELLSSEQATRAMSLRDKMLAHKDGHYDVKLNGHTIDEVFYLLEKMQSILLSLNGLFQRTTYPISESESRAKKIAKDFWEYVANT